MGGERREKRVSHANTLAHTSTCRACALGVLPVSYVIADVPLSPPFLYFVQPQNHREVDKMGKGASGAVRVDDANGGSTLTYGRQFSADSGSLYSSITRETINALKAHFKDQV